MSPHAPQNPSNEKNMVWLSQFRQRVINLLLGSTAFLGTIGLGAAIYQHIRSGVQTISILLAYYLGAYLVLLFLWLNRRISARWRSFGLLVLIYVFSVFAFTSGWIAGGGRHFLLAFVVLATVLLGAQAGLIAIALSLLTFATFALAFTSGLLEYALAPALTDPTIALVEGIGFSMAVGLISIGLWFFQRGLQAANNATRDAQEARRLLTQRADQLDELNRLLEERTRSLEAANQTLEDQMWITTGEARLNDALRGGATLEQIATNSIRKLCEYLPANTGALYIADDGILFRLGRYAYPSEPALPDQIAFGRGLVGQCAADQRRVILDSIFPGQIKISSGLGETTPDNLCILPLIYNQRLMGVIELAALRPFTSQQQTLLENVSENIAVAINTARDRARISDLLDETRLQAETLRAQEEELRSAYQEIVAKELPALQE